MMTEGKMSEWDTEERSESVFFRWSTPQDNVVSLFALELTASKFVQDSSMYPLFFFLHHVVVGLATPMLAPMSRVFFFFCKFGAFRGAAVGELVRLWFGWIGDKVNPHPYHSAFFLVKIVSPA